MKQIFLFIFLFLFTATGFSQSKLALSFQGGYDQNLNYLGDLKKLNTNELPDFSGGVNLIYYMGKKFRLRVESDYSNISFTRDYQTDQSIENNVALTKMAINNISLNPHVDYKLVSLGNLDLYGSAGLRFEFTITDWQRTFNQAGELLSGKYLLDEINPGQAGGTGGLILKYNLSEHLGVQLAPEYTYYFRPLFGTNDNNLQRFSVKAGLEWRF